MERWRLGFLVPVAAAIATAFFIVVIGETLLAVGAPVLFHIGATEVLLAVPVALGMALAVLAGAAIVANTGQR